MILLFFLMLPISIMTTNFVFKVACLEAIERGLHGGSSTEKFCSKYATWCVLTSGAPLLIPLMTIIEPRTMEHAILPGIVAAFVGWYSARFMSVVVTIIGVGGNSKDAFTVLTSVYIVLLSNILYLTIYLT